MALDSSKKKKLVLGRMHLERPWVNAPARQLQDLDYAAALKKGYTALFSLLF
jgi:hypothetical protein